MPAEQFAEKLKNVCHPDRSEAERRDLRFPPRQSGRYYVTNLRVAAGPISRIALC